MAEGTNAILRFIGPIQGAANREALGGTIVVCIRAGRREYWAGAAARDRPSNGASER